MKHKKIIIILQSLIVSSLLYGCIEINKNTTEIENQCETTIKENKETKSLVDEKWYKSQLTSENNQRIYDEIYEALVNKKASIKLKIDDAERLRIIWKSVIYDYPELFYIDTYQYIQHKDNTITIMPIYNMALDDIKLAEADIEVYKADVLRHINSDMSDYEKEKVIYDYIAKNTEYSLESRYNQSLYSVALGKSVCLGHTRMFQYLCQQVNIPCTVITGSNENNVGHAWNAVYIDGAWYMVDCTNSKGMLGDRDDKISYYYFNVSKEQILRSYAINNVVKIPECNSIEAEYFYNNKLYFDSVDTGGYIEKLREAMKKGEQTLEIRCSDNVVLSGLYDWLIEQRNIFNIVGSEYQVTYVKSEKLLTLQVNWQKHN